MLKVLCITKSKAKYQCNYLCYAKLGDKYSAINHHIDLQNKHYSFHRCAGCNGRFAKCLCFFCKFRIWRLVGWLVSFPLLLSKVGVTPLLRKRNLNQTRLKFTVQSHFCHSCPKYSSTQSLTKFLSICRSTTWLTSINQASDVTIPLSYCYWTCLLPLTLLWFKSYLTGRSFMSWWREVSESHGLSTGVLQGSLLGPLLFSLYTTSLCAIICSHGLS